LTRIKWPFFSARIFVRDPELDWLSSPRFETLFWSPERLGQPSAWWGHVPFAFWLVAQCRPGLLLELGTYDGVSYAAFCETVSRLRLGTRCYAFSDWRADMGASADDIYIGFVDFHNRSYASFSKILKQSAEAGWSGFADHTIDLLHINGLYSRSPLHSDFDAWRVKLSDSAVIVFHDINHPQAHQGLSGLFETLKREAPTFEFLHCRGLGIVAIGARASSQVRELCGLSTEHEIAAVRERFSHLGGRWEAVSKAKMALAQAAAAKKFVTETSKDPADSATEIAQLRQQALIATADCARASNSLRALSADLATARDDHAAIFERQERLIRALGQSQRRKQRVLLPRQLQGPFSLLKKRSRKTRRNYALLVRSPLFDAEWYLSQNNDVKETGLDPTLHFLLKGGEESRQPGVFFNTKHYLAANPDVVIAKENPLIHFIRWGAREGRPLGLPLPAQLTSRGPSSLPPEPQPRFENVDIIVCVHNALEDVRRCLESVVAKTLPPYNVVLVDDGSDAPTAGLLSAFAETHGATLVRHKIAKGYTLAANAGLRASSAPFCVLLNSDTEVSEGWLDRLVDYMRRDPVVGVVGPLSNTASWQSVPNLSEGDDWAANELPQGMDVDDMARLVARGASRQGIQLGFINGFCMLIRRQAIEDVGLFDEKTFGAGYGEENDFCIRARQKGWRLVAADDAYVFHHQSRSYGERRHKLVARADISLAAKHSHIVDILPHVLICRDSLQLHRARLRVAANQKRANLSARARSRHEMRRIAFLLPVLHAGGGANVILQEIRAMRRFGVDSWIINRAEYRQGFERSYPGLEIPVIYGEGDLSGKAQSVLAAHGVPVDAIVATASETFDWLPNAPCSSKLAYYIQDVETRFFTDDKALLEIAGRSYVSRPEIARVTKSSWNRNEIVALGGQEPVVIGASVDVDLFYPRSDDGLDAKRPLHIAAMVRPETSRRGPDRTLRVLHRLKDTFNDAVVITCFGGSASDIAALQVPLDGIRVAGKLPPDDVADLLGHTQIFLDFSDWQAMGLTALEAMASGAAVVVPRNGGTGEFCYHELTGLIVESRDEEACFEAACRLVADAELRLALRRAGMETATTLPPETAALNLLQALWGGE
jgi:GT2 family glycosyltransferase